MDWITIQKMAEESGYTLGALRQKIYRSELVEGHHWVKAPDKRVMMHRGNFTSWINSNTNIVGQ